MVNVIRYSKIPNCIAEFTSSAKSPLAKALTAMLIPENRLDPYAAPSTELASSFSNSNELTFPQRKMLKDFQTHSLALGVLWLLFPMLVAGLIGYRIYVDALGWDDSQLLASFIFTAALVFTITCTAGGIGTLLKKQWGLYFGLGASYLSIAFSGASTIVLTIFVIIQGHPVLGFMTKLNSAGIPLTAKPFSAPKGAAMQGENKDLQNLFQ